MDDGAEEAAGGGGDRPVRVLVIDDEDLVFICPKCGSNGRWRAVIMPTERLEIEEVLLMRPGFRDANLNRFWFPGETVENLVDENFIHDAPIPEKHQAGLAARLNVAKALLEAD